MTGGRRPVVVAVDGPAGSGKSSVSRAAARRLGYGYLDTGAAYRAVAWHALDRDIDTEDEAAVLAALDDLHYAIGTDPDHYYVRVGCADVTEAIREPRVTDVVSAIARNRPVRAGVNRLFREIIADAGQPGIVVEGRDITTVVAPEAPVRVLLTASAEVRMARRAAEFTDHAADVIGAQLNRRDAADSQVVDFMTAADGVTTLDSTDLTFDETVDALVALVRARA